MLTNIHLGARVEGKDGENLGRITYLVAEPTTTQVTHFVVEYGAFETRQAVIAISWLTEIAEDGKSVQLDLTKEQLDQFDDFIEREYVTDGVYSSGDSGMLPVDSNGYVYPLVGANPPVAGGYAETLPAPAIIETGNLPVGEAYSEHLNVPPNSLIVREGANVEALDGKLGRVKQVNLDPNDSHIVSFVVEKGFFFTEDIVVPVEMVKAASEQAITLNVNKEDVRNVSDSANHPNTQDFA